jgi:hypothetical protein
MMSVGPGQDLVDCDPGRSWLAAGRLPAPRLDGERLLFPRPDLVGQRPRPHVGRGRSALGGEQFGQRRVAGEAAQTERQRVVDRRPRLAGRAGHLG